LDQFVNCCWEFGGETKAAAEMSECGGSLQAAAFVSLVSGCISYE